MGSFYDAGAQSVKYLTLQIVECILREVRGSTHSLGAS